MGDDDNDADVGDGKKKSAAPYATHPFSRNHSNTKYWNKVKIHPESGCKMTDTNIIHEDTNPCMKEYYQSMNCIVEKAYDRGACAPYYDNYKICKIFWTRVVRDRRLRGIEPMVPPKEEQEAVKQEYLKKKGFEP